MMMRARDLSFAIVSVVLTVNLLFADDDNDESIIIAKIELLGGRISRDHSLPGHPVIGIDFHVSEMLPGFWENTKVGDRDLRLLKHFTQLTRLNLLGTYITDDGLNEIRELNSLTTLILGRIEGKGGVSKISDVGVKYIKELKNLTA